jgi:hypothetical protein
VSGEQLVQETEETVHLLAANGHMMQYFVRYWDTDGKPVVSQHDAEHSDHCRCLQREPEERGEYCPNCRGEVGDESLHAAPCVYCESDGHAGCQCGAI